MLSVMLRLLPPQMGLCPSKGPLSGRPDQHGLCLALTSLGGEGRAPGALSLLAGVPWLCSLPMRPPASLGTVQRGAATGGTCWGQSVSGSGGELDLVRDRLCPRLQAEGQGCDPWGTAPLPQVKAPASATWSTLHPRARIHLWAYGQEDQTASRSDRDGIISLYVLQGTRARVVQPPWTGCTPRGRQPHQPGDSPHHRLQAEHPASLCPGRMCFVTCGSW